METSPARRRRRAPRPRTGAVALTDRDRLLLAFAAEQRFVTAAQIALLLATTTTAADTRLRVLSTGGYLLREQKLYGAPAAHRVTRVGLRATGSDLATPRKLDLATYRHDEALVWLRLAAQRGRFGPLRAVVSERRMRSEDGRRERDGPRHGVRLGGVGPNGRDRRHYPDMVVVTASGHRVAFELELSSKGRERRERILAGYAADRRIDGVIYLVDRPGVGTLIERSAARVGISDLVRVQNVRLRGSPPSAGAARGAERSHGPYAGGPRPGGPRTGAPSPESGR